MIVYYNTHMQRFIDSYQKTKILHHANLFEGEADFVLSLIVNFFEHDVGMYTRGNPDFHIMEYDTFGIDDGREIQNMESKKAVVGDKKIFVLIFNSMTREAQNALLKLFEEPTKGTHFFLITQSADLLLPTLQSRLMIVSGLKSDGEDSDTLEDLRQFAREFLEATKTDRLVMLKEYIEGKDKVRIARFLNALELVVHEIDDYQKNGKLVSALKYIEDNKQYIYDRSASLKLLLEHIALAVPQLKF